jgi:hypothetical protein
MKYGPFDLTHATAAELLFSYWTDLDPEEDELFWGASKSDFLYWGRSAHGDSDGWQQVSFDLEDYVGEEEVWIAFAFESDADLTGEGAYLDDILLRAQIGPQERQFVYLPLIILER